MIDFRKLTVYQIYPKSFKDSDGDGLGDLQGIIEKLDYIEELGVNCIWLTPIYPSPQKDNGYDVADYTAIDPRYGTMDDFDHLVTQCKKRDIIIMLDMVFNHTSDQHPWFQKAITDKKNKDYKNYYIFKVSDSEEPTNWISKFGGSTWEKINENEYYLHLFDKTQPDLNWENPQLRQEIYNIMEFWLKKGIRSFRFDVINLISKPEIYVDDHIGDGRRFYTDGPKIHEYLKELHKNTFGKYENTVTVGEMSSTTIDNCIKYSNPEEKELDMTFSFHHLKVDYENGDKWSDMAFDFLQLKKILIDWQIGMEQGGGHNALFWCNHDQPRIVSRFGNDIVYRVESAKMLATAMHMLKGTPYVYQGEEIGMTNPNFTSIDRYRDVESINYYAILKQQGKSDEE
ncbi:MAG: alpha,alpha-phosphotrehalase, partial [Defluviitaleaceae bacterium]|nr:alpha,alpha-phosphotrehalase [Defluviitaleaceae bacterium]